MHSLRTRAQLSPAERLRRRRCTRASRGCCTCPAGPSQSQSRRGDESECIPRWRIEQKVLASCALLCLANPRRCQRCSFLLRTCSIFRKESPLWIFYALASLLLRTASAHEEHILHTFSTHIYNGVSSKNDYCDSFSVSLYIFQ